MKNSTFITLPVMSLLLISGCANLPDAKIGYYLPKTQIGFKVVRSIACNAQNYPIVANNVTPIVTHSADIKELLPIDLNGLQGVFNDADVKLEFYNDGRLKAINTSNTGQGEAIFKTGVSIVSAVVGLKVFSPKPPITPNQYKEKCEFIKGIAKDEPLTLTYSGDINITETEYQKFKADAQSQYYDEVLRIFLGNIQGKVIATTPPQETPVFDIKEKNGINIKALNPGYVEIGIEADNISVPSDNVIWTGSLPVADLGRSYDIPIPKPALFGKTTFAATFGESGALTSVQYVSSTGAGQVLNVVDSAIGEFHQKTTAEKAAQVKAEADLIVQQQRLVKCLANPSSCE